MLNGNSTVTIQEQGLTFIHDKFKAVSNEVVNTFRRPNVILIGIDTMSRMNFRRTMPKTFELLQDKKWFELQGYNKVIIF